jgi:hypothetical protein
LDGKAWTLLIAAGSLALGSTPAGAARRSEADALVAASSDVMTRRIDQVLAEAWSAAGVEPAPPAADGEFLRRACLDLTGVIPRVSEVREFLADPRPDKRAVLIDRLLESPRCATHLATTWRNRIIPLGEDPARTREALALQKWLRGRFAENVRYDRIVGGLLLAGGDNELGPALYFQANDLAPEKLAGSSAELFLGVDLHCAQCHDHPFSEWSQRDFWGLAAFFARVKSADGGNMMMEPNASYRLVDVEQGEVTLPDSDEIVSPRFPRGGAASDDEWQSRRSQLVVWLTSRDNKLFSRTAVNVAWEHLFGLKLVERVDAMTDADFSPQEQLLDELALSFVDSGFDLRQLWRTLLNSRAYALSSRADSEKAAAGLFARMQPKALTPEQLYDSLLVLAPTAKTAPAWGDASPAGGGGLDEDPNRIEFVRRMRTPPGSATQYRAGTLQALMLMNGVFTDNVSAHDRSSLLGALNAPFMTDDNRIEALFFATLAREPTADERGACLDELQKCATAAERQRAQSDMLWALVNSTEFAFNH